MRAPIQNFAPQFEVSRRAPGGGKAGRQQGVPSGACTKLLKLMNDPQDGGAGGGRGGGSNIYDGNSEQGGA